MIFPHRLSWLAWPLFALPTVAQFNDTFKFTVDSLDGLVDVDGASEWWGGPPFTMDNATGYRTSAGSGGSSGCAFVGVGFEVQGFARWRNANHQVNQVNKSDPQSINPVLGFLQRPTVGTAGPSTQLNGTVRETPDLMSASGLNLSAYELRWSYSPDAIFEFHNFTIDVPVRTQAPSVKELESQATFAPAVLSQRRINPRMSFAFSQKTDEFHMLQKPLQLRDVHQARHLKRDVSYAVDEDSVLLKNNTELSYLAPANTTLIRVYGRVGKMNNSVKGSHCYADLDPRPSWFQPGDFPISAQEKAIDAHNRTLFILPIDPAVRTTVRVGSLDLDTTCFLSGFSTYPFHYNYTLANLANVDSQKAQSDGNHTAINKTGVIVGSVVGVAGALAVAALALLFVHRRHRKKETEHKHDAQPYIISEKELYWAAGWAPHNTAGQPDEVGGGDQSDTGTEISPQDDGVEEVEYLPPRYREWQPGTGIEPEQSPSIVCPTPASTAREVSLPPMQHSMALKEGYLRGLDSHPNSSGTSTFTDPSLQLGYKRSVDERGPATEMPTLKEDYTRLFGMR